MKRQIAALVMAFVMLVPAIGWTQSAPPDSGKKWSRWDKFKARDEQPSIAARADSLQPTTADTEAFLKALDTGQADYAMKMLWLRSEPKKDNDVAAVAGVAAMFAGAGLMLAANEQLGALNDAEDLGVEVDKNPWQLVFGAGAIAAVTGLIAIIVD